MAKEMKCLWYEDDFFYKFLNSVMREEFYKNPFAYTMAIRATLISLGYDEKYINGEFKRRMEDYFSNIANATSES